MMSKTATHMVIAAVLALQVGCLAFHRGAMPGEPKSASFLQVQGVRVRYVDVGEGPAVVLLHGFASSLETWLTLQPQLVAAHRRVIALDLKGFGWTDRPDGDYSPQAQARLVQAVLDARGVQQVAVVAHSWGSSVALALALLDPKRVTRIALYDAWVYDAQMPPFFRWAEWPGLGEALFGLYYDQRPDERMALAFHDPSLVSQALMDDVERSLERPGTKAAALAAVRGQQFIHWQAQFRTIRQPVLLLWGREDVVSRPEFADRLMRDLPDARVRWFAHCGHFPMLEAARESDAALLQFLAEGP
jgi:pimeloyl-ACP methyl ester carboxylesterase